MATEWLLLSGSKLNFIFFASLKNAYCTRQFSSYRTTFWLNKSAWTTIRVPWSSFHGHGPETADVAFDVSTLRRLGVVAIGKEMDATLALSSIKFYSEWSCLIDSETSGIQYDFKFFRIRKSYFERALILDFRIAVSPQSNSGSANETKKANETNRH